MPDATFIGYIGAAATLLGSLNKARPKDDFEAAKILDENDPIKLTLLAMTQNVPKGTTLLFINGSSCELEAVLETGYAAARLRVTFVHERKSAGVEDALARHYETLTSNILVRTTHIAVIRYSCIASVLQRAQ